MTHICRFNVPVIVPISKNKKFSLNLNQYRNAHYQVLNKAKRTFEDLIKDTITTEVPVITDKVKIRYVLYINTERRLDISNVCSVVDKFVCDALVKAGKLSDDNYKYVDEVTYKACKVAKSHPMYVSVTIEDYHI